MTKRQQAVAFFIQQSWTAQQSAGIVANLEAESGLRPDAVGDGGQAYGIAQWHPPRQTNFAAVLGKDIRGSSLEEQLYFVHAELRGTEKKAGDALAACMAAGEAGACVSKMYERPADAEGDAAKRAQLAESIFAEYAGQGSSAPQQPAAQPAPVATPRQQQGGSMGGIALVLPLVQSIIGMFSPKGQTAVGAIVPATPAQMPDTGDPKFNAIMQVINGVMTSALAASGHPDPATASDNDRIKAAAAVMSTPSIAAKVEDDAMTRLDHISPFIDKLFAAEERQAAATRVGRNEAMVRQQSDKTGTVRVVVNNITSVTWLVLGGLMASIFASVVAKAIWHEMPDYLTTLIALSGPLFGQVMKERGAVIAYYFDGTPESNATSQANAELVKSRTP